MKQFRKISAISFLLLCNFFAKAQWQVLPPLPDVNFSKVSFASDSLGMIMTYGPTMNPFNFYIVYKTSDMGITWNPVMSLPNGSWPSDIQFLDAQHCYLSVNYNPFNAKILKSADAGNTWTDISPDTIDSV